MKDDLIYLSYSHKIYRFLLKTLNNVPSESLYPMSNIYKNRKKIINAVRTHFKNIKLCYNMYPKRIEFVANEIINNYIRNKEKKNVLNERYIKALNKYGQIFEDVFYYHLLSLLYEEILSLKSFERDIKLSRRRVTIKDPSPAFIYGALLFQKNATKTILLSGVDTKKYMNKFLYDLKLIDRDSRKIIALI